MRSDERNSNCELWCDANVIIDIGDQIVALLPHDVYNRVREPLKRSASMSPAERHAQIQKVLTLPVDT